MACSSPKRPSPRAAAMVETASAAETEAFGERLGHACRGGEVIALIGPLGAGKTCLVRGLARGLGTGEQEVASPTFAVIHEYEGRIPLIHIDLYRIEADDALYGLGLEEYLEAAGVTAIEWGDKVRSLLPCDHLRIELEHLGGDRRRMLLYPFTDRYCELVLRVTAGNPNSSGTEAS